MICYSCKQEIDEGTIFCRHCGTNQNLKSNMDQEIIKLKNEIKSSNEGLSQLQSRIASKDDEIKSAKTKSYVMIGVSVVLAIIMISVWVRTGEAVSDAAYYEDQYNVINNEKNSMVSQYNDEKNSIVTDYENQLNTLKSEANNYKTEVENLKSQLSELDQYKNQVSNMEQKLNSIIPNKIKIRINQYYNGDSNLTNLGSYLDSSTIRFLLFDYEVLTADDVANYYGEEIKMSVYRPDGSLSQGDNSPSDCSFTRQIDGNYSTAGWGSDSGGTYYPGWYVFVFTYDGVEVGRDAVYVN